MTFTRTTDVFELPALSVPSSSRTYESFGTVVVSNVASVAPGAPLVLATRMWTSDGVAAGKYLMVPVASVMSDDRTIGTSSESLAPTSGAAIQPCVRAAPPLAGWIQTTESDDEASWKFEPNAVACRTSVPVLAPTYANGMTPFWSVISVAVSVSVWPVSSGPAAESATARFAPTSDGSGSTVTVARSATVR